MNGRVNMHDIAKRAKVSLGTVSHVVNGSVAVREPLRQRVLKAIQELGYQPSQLARGLRRDYTNMIGMIIPDITNPFFPALVRAAEDVAFTHQFRMVLCNSDNNPEKEASYWSEMQSYLPAGLLLIPAVGSNLHEQPLRNGRVTPTVCIDRKPVGWKGDVVRADNEGGSYAATRHLIDQGHHQIATVTGSPDVGTAKERLRGYRRAMKEAGLTVPPNYIEKGNFDRSSGFEAGLRLLRPATRPTAIFAGNDMMAMGVLLALRELGLHCPEDVSVVGFDNLDATELLQPSLTTVAQSAYRMGTTAANLLLERISGIKAPPREVVLETELIRRDSVMRLRPHAAAGRRGDTPDKRGDRSSVGTPFQTPVG
ncbi:MAG TPA: LacI family DNA-binding transcriptional regulator [Terracidiphilus sp.]|jgi:LacI family transcriptional regulator